MNKCWVVPSETQGMRLDKFLAARVEELSRTKIQQRITGGDAQVDGQTVKPSYVVNEKEQITLEITDLGSTEEPKPQSLPLEVIYEDSSLIIVNKPTGMVVHPAPGHRDGTLVNALVAHCHHLPDTEEPRRPGIVHRLDKGTSGILVVAKSRKSLESLKQQFQSREVPKTYFAVVEGNFSEKEGVIEAPIGRHSRQKTKMAVTLSGKSARTEFQVLESLPDNKTLLRVNPISGRTHQIRVHLSYIDKPVVGDQDYGNGGDGRIMLHAFKLQFRHPETTNQVSFEAPLPEEFPRIPEEFK